MEDSSIDSGFDAPADLKIPIGIGILGIIIGGLALIIAFVVRGKVDRFTTKVDSDIEEIHAIASKATAEQGLGENSKDAEALRQELSLLREEMARKFEALEQKDKSLEDTVVAIDKRVNGRRPAAPVPVASGASAGSSATASSSGEYVIQKDDTFTKIAKKVGCKVSELTDLNPDIEPARLRIGQKIKVPANR